MARVRLVDLTTKKGSDMLASWLKNPRVVGVFLAPPCGTASHGRSIKLKRKRNAPEPLRSDNHPNGLKNLSFINKIKISQTVKGGGDVCRPPENSANDSIVQRWGVYHTPEEFVQKAAQARHPQSLETCLPAVLKQAIESHKNGTSTDRIRKRATIMRDWVRRVELLKSSELELKSKLHPHPKQILSDKKILLWKSLLEEYKYSDMSVVDELLQGTNDGAVASEVCSVNHLGS